MKKAAAVIVLLLGCGVLFYWFSYRPSEIRKTCHADALQRAQSFYDTKASEDKYGYDQFYKREYIGQGYYQRNDYEADYQECLRSKGL